MEQVESKLDEVLCKLLDERLNFSGPSDEGRKIDADIVKLAQVRNEALKLNSDYVSKEEDRKVNREKIELDREKHLSSSENERKRLDLEKARLDLEIEIERMKMEIEQGRLNLDSSKQAYEQTQGWLSKWGPSLAGAGITVVGGIAAGFLNMMAEERTVGMILNYEEENTITSKAGNYAGKFRPFGRK